MRQRQSGPVLLCALVSIVCVAAIIVYTLFEANFRLPPVAYQRKQTTTSGNGITDEVWLRRVITRPGPAGRLGNQMFQYASLLGIAAMNNMTPVYQGIGSTLDWTFENLPAIQNAKRYRQKADGVTEIREYSNWIYDNRFERLHTLENGDVFIRQFFQSWKYFQRIPTKIRRAFTFRKHHTQVVDRFLAESSSDVRAKNQRPVFVGVHIRRTDWVAHMPNNDVGGQDYLLRAVKRLNDELVRTKSAGCVIYVVCSDDQPWTRANFQSIVKNVTTSSSRLDASAKKSEATCVTKVVHSPGLSASEDMALLAACNHTIITIGTYGWWGAWLAGGITIAFNKYPPFSNKLTVSLEDCYPPDWITIS